MFTRRQLIRGLSAAVAVLSVALTASCSHSGKKETAAGSAAVSSTGSTGPAASSPGPKASASGAGTSSSPKVSLVPSVAISTKPAVPFSAPGDFGGGVTVKVTKSTDQTSSDTGPGSIKGQAAVAFTLAFTNGSGQVVPVDTVNVTASYGSANTPASPVNASTNSPLSGRIKPGATATGVYAFAIPKDERTDVTLQLWYAQGKPVVVFSGSVS